MSTRSVWIKDVAAAAGVSTATVSRTLSNPAIVSDKTRKAVHDAIEKTGYVFNATASNFRRQRTGMIVAFIPNIFNPYYPAILSGIASVLADTQHSLVVVDTNAGKDALHVAQPYFDTQRADGLIVTIGSLPDELVNDWCQRGKVPPIVHIGEWPDGVLMPRITIRNEPAAQLAIAHLIQLGHEKIGFLSGPSNFTNDQRLSGMLKMLQEHSLEMNPDWIIEGDLSLESGKRAAQKWIDMKRRPTGVFIATDVVACGFMGELLRNGVNVPADVSVVGFDDVEIAAHIYPALTTIRQPRFSMGQRAAELLLQHVNDDKSPPSTQVLDVELIVRDSTAAARAMPLRSAQSGQM